MTVTVTQTINDLAEIRDLFDAINGGYANIKTHWRNLVTQFDSTGVEDLISLPNTAVGNVLTALDTAQTALQSLAQARLSHREMLETFAGMRSASWQEGLHETAQKILTDGDSIAQNAVTVGTITKTATNTNAGDLNTTTKLSGVDAPAVGGFASSTLFDVTTELTKSDSVMVRCTRDSQSNSGLSRGLEYFEVTGFPTQAAPFSARYTQDGDGTTRTDLRPVHGRSTIDLDLDDYTVANTPDDWTITAGTPGTEIKEESTIVVGATGKSLELTGTSGLTYPITNTDAIGRGQFVLCFLVRKDSGVSSGTYNFKVTGTGFSTVQFGATNATTLTTTFMPKAIRIPVPASIPSDFKITIETTSIAGGAIYFDYGAFASYQYWNGIGLALLEGQDSFTVNDRFTFSLTNDYAADTQTSLARIFRFQFPSSGTPTL